MGGNNAFYARQTFSFHRLVFYSWPRIRLDLFFSTPSSSSTSSILFVIQNPIRWPSLSYSFSAIDFYAQGDCRRSRAEPMNKIQNPARCKPAESIHLATSFVNQRLPLCSPCRFDNLRRLILFDFIFSVPRFSHQQLRIGIYRPGQQLPLLLLSTMFPIAAGGRMRNGRLLNYCSLVVYILVACEPNTVA